MIRMAPDALITTEHSVIKTHDGGLKDMRRDRKVVRVYPNTVHPERCTVTLVDKLPGAMST